MDAARCRCPAGEPLAGMVHHKIHDDDWTGLPLDPAADPKVRELHRPSTAATLNLAAVAAQGARLFDRYDAAFADRLLAAAPDRVGRRPGQPARSTRRPPTATRGGGPYDDSDVTDEFYWAAAELYLTTARGRSSADAVTGSPLHHGRGLRRRRASTGATWPPSAASTWPPCRTSCRDRRPGPAVGRSTAPTPCSASSGPSRGVSRTPRPTTYWAWGSNSQSSTTWSCSARPTTSAAGRSTSERRGRGDGLPARAQRAQHLLRHRLRRRVLRRTSTAGGTPHQLNPSCPHPPLGLASPAGQQRHPGPAGAGAVARAAAPQFCYIDDINSWSTNEITINWNSALAWVASFVADQDDGGR